MGTFRTKLDFSDNRQVKQRIETTTNLSGATTFGVPFGNLPTGPNPVLSSITQNISNVLGTFSGNSGTTVFTWTDSRFNLGDSTFSAITPSNSGVTQNSGNVFAPVPSSLFTIDGNSGYTQYSGVSFTMYPTTFIDLGGGAYSGELATYVSQIIDATGLDFSGRTIWNDVSGITRTDRLIISRNPQIGYTWTCIDSEGMGEWQYNGSSSGTTIWTAGTGANSAVLGGSNGIASGSTSVSEGVNTTAGGIASHAGGNQTTINGDYGFAHSAFATIDVDSDYSAILGGEYHLIKKSTHSSIIGGYQNYITGNTGNNYNMILGGTGHTLTKTESSIILGGALNTIDTAKYSIIVGGSGNTVTKNTDNLTQPNYSGIFAGKNNKIIPRFGSGNNIVSGSYCAIVGGESNTISGHSHSFIGGGMNNLIECDAAFNAIVAGQDNINHAFNGVIIGGQSNILGVSTSCPSQAENSIILGGKLNKIASSSVKSAFNSSIIGGANNLIDNTVNDLKNTVIIGGEYITANTSDTVYVPNMIINTGGTTSKLGINTSSPQYVIDAKGNNARLFLGDTYTGDDLPFKSFAFSANSANVPQIAAITNSYLGGYGLSLQMGVVGDNSISTATSELIGLSGDTYLSSSQKTNNLNIINRSGSNGTNNIRMYAGVDSVSAASVPDFIIRGSGTTRGFVGIGVVEPTQQLDISGNTRIRSIGSSASSGALHYTADGTLTTNTSDERLKTNITTLTGALNKVNQLRGVTYNWTENPNGDTRIGFIAQEVNSVVPELTFTNPNSSENYMGVHYDNITALLVEAVKELSSGITISNNTHLETQTILAEDNNIDLNFNGTQQTAIGGGLTVLHAKGQDQSANLITDVNGNFVTNNDFKPQALTIPLYTPTSSNDTTGSEGNITRDDNFLYIKTSSGWKRTNLENF